MSDVENVQDVQETGDEKEAEVFPSFFIDEDETVHVDFVIGFNKNSGKIEVLSNGINFNEDDILGEDIKVITCWADFTIPTYNEMMTYRRLCSGWDGEAKQYIRDDDMMRIVLLRNHLKDWNITDSKGEVIKLERTKDGGLNENTMREIGRIMPAVIEYMMSQYEVEILLS